MNTTTLKIVSRHSKLSDAVAAAGIDLSYNEPLARADLARDDRDTQITQVFVVRNETNGETEVWFHYRTYDILLLNKYSPFHSSLSDTRFSVVVFGDDEIAISRPFISRNARETIMDLKLTVAVL
jgi:hypothetical protein